MSSYHIRLVGQSYFKDESLQAATRDERQQFTEEVTGDGTVDRKGNIAKRQKTGGWRAAPLIFGMSSTILPMLRI